MVIGYDCYKMNVLFTVLKLCQFCIDLVAHWLNIELNTSLCKARNSKGAKSASDFAPFQVLCQV